MYIDYDCDLMMVIRLLCFYLTCIIDQWFVVVVENSIERYIIDIQGVKCIHIYCNVNVGSYVYLHLIHVQYKPAQPTIWSEKSGFNRPYNSKKQKED